MKAQRIKSYLGIFIILISILFSCISEKVSEINSLKICYIGERDKSYPCIEFSLFDAHQANVFIYEEKIDKHLMDKINVVYNNSKIEKNILGVKYLEIEVSSNNKKEHILLNKDDAIHFLSNITSLIDRKKMPYFYLNSMNNILKKK